MTPIVGIPGTIDAKSAALRWHRMPDHAGCRRYRADNDSGVLIAMVGQEPAGTEGRLLWHISVSHRDLNMQPDRCPTWDELKSACYRLVPADVPMILVFPRRSSRNYVNIAETCLHLWESEDATIDQ